MKQSLTLALLGATAILFTGSVSALAAPGERGGRLEKMMTRMDTDQSGTISYEEFSKRGDDNFTRMDADGDGLVTPDERQTAKQIAEEEAKEATEGMGGFKARKARKMMKGQAKARLDKVDTDQDGNISLAEHQAAQQERFAALDADGSGAITADEFEAQMAERRAKMKERRGK